MRIVTDRDRCMGAGQCVLHAPEVFDQSDEDGIVLLRTDAPPADQHEAVRLAARMCPNQVITLHETPHEDTVTKPAGADAAESALRSAMADLTEEEAQQAGDRAVADVRDF